MINIKRGDIFMVDLPFEEGSVQHGYRPAVIIQNNIGNRFSPTTIIASITSKKEEKNYLPTHILLRNESNIERNSVILCEQVRTIDKKVLRRKIGQLRRKKLIELNIALAVSVIPGAVWPICKFYNKRAKWVEKYATYDNEGTAKHIS